MLVSHKIVTKWSKRNRKYYVEKGYRFTDYGEEFEVSINDIEKGSSLPVKFVCDYCNGENQKEVKDKFKPYNNLMKSRKNTDKDCCGNEECKVKKSREFYIRKINKNGTTIVVTHPHLIKEWSNKNHTKPFEHASGSRFKVLWECSDGHEWYAYINDRCKRNSGCPYCVGTLVSIENSLPFTNLDLFKEWNHNKNSNIDPYKVSKGTNKKVWWICDKGHEWESTIASRGLQGVGCPYCDGKKASKENCLATINPKLSREWNYNKNKGLTPFDVVTGSGKKMWWICENNHEWEASINSRNRGSGCPYCSGVKVCLDNCLATLRPDLVIEWNSDMNKNITPFKVTLGSDAKVWWKCKQCNNSWEAKVNNRVYGNGCPQCKESKGEKKVREFLELKQINFIPQYEFNDLNGIGGKNLKFDFAVFNFINNLQCLIEYDGEYHFNKVYEDDGHETIVEHDKRKNEYCKNNNIKLIRIPYWDFDSIEDILTKELVKYKLVSPNS